MVASRSSIRLKLIAIVMLMTCAALGFAGLGLTVFERLTNRMALHKEVATVSGIISANSTAALTFKTRPPQSRS